MYQLIGLLGFISVIVSILDIEAGIGAYIDIPSFFIIIFMTYFLMLISYGTSIHPFIYESAIMYFKRNRKVNVLFSDMAKTAGKYVILSGVIICLIILMKIYSYIKYDSFSFKQVMGIYLCLISIWYSCLFYGIVFMPLSKLWKYNGAPSSSNSNGDSEHTDENENSTLTNAADEQINKTTNNTPPQATGGGDKEQ